MAASQQTEEFKHCDPTAAVKHRAWEAADLNGRRVRLLGLKSRPALNGIYGTVRRFDAGRQRHEVRLDGDTGEITILD